jgi:hypothetical protein
LINTDILLLEFLFESLVRYLKLHCSYLQDLKLINADLTAKAFVDILASDEPKLRDPAGAINMELEVLSDVC